MNVIYIEISDITEKQGEEIRTYTLFAIVVEDREIVRALLFFIKQKTAYEIGQ